MRTRTLILLIAVLQVVFAIAQNNTSQSGLTNKDALIADSLNLTSRRLMFKLKYDSAKYYLDKALGFALQSGNNNIIARCYVDYGNMHNLQGKHKTASQYIQTAAPYLEKADNYEVKISGLMLQATLYMVSGKKDSAVYYYRIAENYNAEKMPYRNYLVYMSLGELYNQIGDIGEAEKYLRKSYNLTVNKEGKPDHIYLLTVFLNFYLAKNKPADAAPLIEEFNLLVEDRKKKNITDPLRDILMGITNSKLANSIEFMKSVKESSINTGMIGQALIANNYLIKNLEKKKNYADAMKLATESESLSEKTGNIYSVYETKKIKYGLLEKMGEHKQANTMADTLFGLKDSILALEKREQLFEWETKFETEKKQKEIALLSSSNKLKEKEIALLVADKKMGALLLQQQIMQQGALARENLLMDSIVKSEKAYNALLATENDFKEAKLNKEKELMQALTRENILQARKVKKERQTKWVLAGGAALLLLSGVSILALYRKQKRKNSIIQKQAADLEVLMKEIHHRVKNNLQVVSSLLDLQSHTITDMQAHEAVKEGKNRVQSMALIHQNLYSEGNIKGIKVREYVSNLLQTLCDSYNITNDKVKIKASIDDLNLDVDTMIPLGLVINELVSNAFKYAFKEKQAGELEITLKENADKLSLLVKDNGSGFPAGLDTKNTKSFGLRMIRAFAQKLKAKLDIYNNNGAVVEMEIAKFKMA
ncbi:MAG: sensor histidine kinase [Chitinophagaceae bacterium]